MLRKITGILLLACLIAPFGGYYLFLLHKKHQLKKETKLELSSYIDHNNLVLLSFSSNDIKTLKWKDNLEFEYKGQMYDIVESHIEGETIHYKCFRDTKETSLNKKIEQIIARAIGSDPQKSENQKKLISFIKIQFLPANKGWNVANDFSIKNPFCAYNEFSCSQLLNPPPSPPPKSV